MAGVEKIVKDDVVFKIANRLMEQGKKVSNRAVWAEVGGGSMTTIAAALRRWREHQKLQTEKFIEHTPLPPLLIDAMHSTVDLLWRTAQDEVQKEMYRLIQSMNYCVAEAIIERDDALSELQHVSEELQAMYNITESAQIYIEANEGLALSKTMVRVNFDLDKESHTKLKVYAAKKGQSITDILREFINSIECKDSLDV